MKAIILAASLGLLFGTVPALAKTHASNGTSGTSNAQTSPATPSNAKSARADANGQKQPKSTPSLKSPPAVPMPTGNAKVPRQDRPGEIVPDLEAR